MDKRLIQKLLIPLKLRAKSREVADFLHGMQTRKVSWDYVLKISRQALELERQNISQNKHKNQNKN